MEVGGGLGAYARKYDVVDGTAVLIIHKPPPLLGRLLLQFNAAQQNEITNSNHLLKKQTPNNLVLIIL